MFASVISQSFTRTPPREAVTATPPFICIEIRSPEDRKSRIVHRLEDYFAMGVPHIWWIDPVRRLAHTYSANGLEGVEGNILTVPNTSIRVDLSDLFTRIDKKTPRNIRF